MTRTTRNTRARLVVDDAGRFIPIKDAAASLGVHDRTLRRRIAEGALPGYRFGGRVFVDPADVRRLFVRIPTGRAS